MMMDYKRIYFNWVLNRPKNINKFAKRFFANLGTREKPLTQEQTKYIIKLFHLLVTKCTGGTERQSWDTVFLKEVLDTLQDIKICCDILEILRLTDAPQALVDTCISKIITLYGSSGTGSPEKQLKQRVLKVLNDNSDQLYLSFELFGMYSELVSDSEKFEEQHLHEIPMILKAIDKYIECVKGENVTQVVVTIYSKIFDILSNLAFIDIIDPKHLELAKTLYVLTTVNVELQSSIMWYVSNVFKDNVYKKDAESLYNELMIDFMNKNYTIHPEKVIEVISGAETISNEMLDIFVYIVAHNTDEMHEWKFYKGVSDFSRVLTEEQVKYVVTNSTFKYFVNHDICHLPLYLIGRYCQLFSSWTFYPIGSQFFYRYFLTIKDLVPSPNMVKYTFFALSNIMTEPDLYNVDIIVNYVSTHINVCEDLEMLYFIFSNCIDSVETTSPTVNMSHFLSNPIFVREFCTWLNTVDTRDKHVPNIIHCIFNYMSTNDFEYLYKVFPIHNQKWYPLVEKYLHGTLAQKCAIELYRRQEVSMDDLNALDVQIYVLTNLS